jgi:hypothetical protein
MRMFVPFWLCRKILPPASHTPFFAVNRRHIDCPGTVMTAFVQLSIMPVSSACGQSARALSGGTSTIIQKRKGTDMTSERIMLHTVAYFSNDAFDRTLTDHLYGGDERYRLCQEVVLGVGGVRMLRALGYQETERFHMNEGHAALLALELFTDELARTSGGREEAIERVKRRRLLLEDLAGNFSPQQHESSGIALEGVDHIRLMLTDLLTATQAHTGKLTVEVERDVLVRWAVIAAHDPPRGFEPERSPY